MKSFFCIFITILVLLIKPVRIILPSSPQVIRTYDYNDNLESRYIIADIKYEMYNEDSIKLYFSGEKTYDINGQNFGRSCNVAWKLKNSDGYTIESGTFYSPSLMVGEKFRDKEVTVHDCIVPGETYTLEITNISY